MLSLLKKIIPLKIKRSLVSLFSREEVELPSGRRAFVFLAADYGNIGDLAITAAQVSFLKKHAGVSHVVRVPISKTVAHINSIKRQVNRSDLITIVGGGNMGSLYPDIEELRQLVVRSFKGNRVVCFPQTLDWDESSESNSALAGIVRVYSCHPSLDLFARESVTQKKLDELFRDSSSVRIGYVPDIVLSATATELGATIHSAPSGTLLCLRDDRECAINSNQRSALEAALKSAGHTLEATDTHAGGARLDPEKCARLVADKLDQFAASRLVVTDRLHGMILSIIAGTPCIVLPNSNHKIHQTWKDWLGTVPQVRFILPSDLISLPELAAELLALPRRDPKFSPMSLLSYESLKQATLRS